MPGHELIGQEELDQIIDIFKNSNGVLFAHGYDAKRAGRYRVREFEQAVAKKMGVKYCQAVSSGTAAIHTALHALKIGPGDEVITQSFTFVATIEAINALGATPILVDIDETLNMCPEALKKAITNKTKCIMPVHMMGNSAHIDKIISIANQHKIPVIEDACQAMGASFQDKPLGTIGRAGILSLDYNKTITTGEGGLILTNDAEIKKHISAFHDHGHENVADLPRGCDRAYVAGFNYRMTELQAAVGLAQLPKLDFIVEANRKNKTFIKEGLSALGDKIKFRDIPDPQGELADAVMFYLPNAKVAQAVVDKMTAEKVGTKNVPDAIKWHFASYWPHIWKNHPIYANCYETQWKASFDLLARCVSLPINVMMTKETLQRTVEVVTNAVVRSV